MEVYEVRLTGEIELPAGVMNAWRALPLDPSTYSDWPDAFARVLDGDEVVTVGAWLDDCQRDERAGERTFLDVRIEGDRVRLEAVLDTPEYEQYRVQIATMFRLVDRVGGTARLAIVSRSDQAVKIGYVVEAKDGRSTMRACERQAA